MPNEAWVTDITYIRTHEGWLYLSLVIDLFSRQVVGWSMGNRIDTQLALDALLMAVWQRRPSKTVLVHSDQGCQFTSDKWQDFLKSHKLQPSMSRRGNCHDNTVADIFFQLLKRERIRRRPMPPGKLPAAMSSTTSKCSITPDGATQVMTACRLPRLSDPTS